MGAGDKRRELGQWRERRGVLVELEHQFAFCESERQQWVSVCSISEKCALTNSPRKDICLLGGQREEPLEQKGRPNTKFPQIQPASTSGKKKSGRRKKSVPIKGEWRPKWLHPSHCDEQRYFLELFSYNNLLWAHLKARKNKTGRLEVLRFEQDLHANLSKIQKEIIDNTFRFGPYKNFTLFDQKKREISTTKYPDRIVHWVVYEYLTRLFEPTFIHDSYGNRKGKGTLKGAKRAQEFMRSKKNTHVLKMDLSKYYFSIPHHPLIDMISRKVTNPHVLRVFINILESYKTPDDFDELFPEKSHYRLTYNKGMPIGALISQICANIYASPLDAYIKRSLRIKHYVRYVDDLVLFGPSRSSLKETSAKIEQFLESRLGLWPNPKKSTVFSKERGLDFLGFRIYPYAILPRKTTQKKMRAALKNSDVALLLGLRGQYIHTQSHVNRLAEFAIERHRASLVA